MMKIVDTRILLSTLCLIFLLVGCQKSRPKDVLSPDRMEAFLYDFHLAKSLGDDAEYSERYNRSLYVDYVYNKHSLSKEEFEYSMAWYTRNLPELVKIYDRISARMGTDKDEIDQLVAWQYDTPMISVSGDSVDIWAWHQVYRLTGTPLNNSVLFTLPVDSNFYEGDKLAWNVRFNYANPSLLDSASTAVMQLALFFDNDSMLVHTDLVQEIGIKTITLQSDSLWTLKNIKGFVYYPPQKTEHRLLIDSVSLYRYHLPKDTTTLVDSLSISPSVGDADSLLLQSVGRGDTLLHEVDTVELTTLKEIGK